MTEQGSRPWRTGNITFGNSDYSETWPPSCQMAITGFSGSEHAASAVKTLLKFFQKKWWTFNFGSDDITSVGARRITEYETFDTNQLTNQ